MEYLKTVLEDLSGKILITDEKLKVIFLNKSAEDFLCTSLKECKGKSVDFVFKEKPANDLEMKEILENKKPLKRHITTLFLKDKLRKRSSFLATPFSNKKEKGIVFEFFDQNSKNSIADRMNKRAASSITQAFSKGLAHEIKNPLSGIRGAAQLLSQKIKDKKKKEFAEIILKETDRLTNIVNQVSDNSFKLNPTYQNIHTILEKIPSFIETLEQDKKINIVRDYDPSLPLISVDSSLISQVFFNLATNTVEALKNSKNTGKITIRSRVMYEVYINHKKHKIACQIDFIDNGPGIPDDLIDSVFFPLVSSKEITSGLGLSIVKGIINQHGGSIDCSSDNSGTTFSILLPIKLKNQKKIKIEENTNG